MTSRTALHDTKLPLRTWLIALCLVTTSSKGISALWGVDPLAYLTDILPKLANGWRQDRLHELPPGRWQPGAAAP